MVDDDSDDLLLFGEALKTCCHEWEYTTASDPCLLFGMLEQFTPDLLILDLNLPKLSGLDCLKLIKSNSRTKEIPVVIFSTSHNKKEMDECFQNGAINYYTKPASFLELKVITAHMCEEIGKPV
jgi:CheY-like chemotaxis protein